MKSLLNKRLSPKRRNKQIKYVPVTETPNTTSQRASIPEKTNSRMIKSILKSNDGAHEPESKSVRISETSPHPQTSPISNPTRIPAGQPSEEITSMNYNASELEKGNLGISEETTPLLETDNQLRIPQLGKYQTIIPNSDPIAELHCWSPPAVTNPIPPDQNPPFSADDPVPPPASSSSQVLIESPLSRFFKALYERYPVIITYILVSVCIIGALYSLITGKGSEYLWVIIKACVCFVMGTDIARMLFGDQFCDVEIKGS
ncbi:unnamed protein product [Kluyveromyces dobzhanskii CBS 2104]|uniref:WGS project CCBQ000000000 data, contig 00107 n=1 Tax=Kluyveromyces dobzhanskii CBS 2104 TaxID=1427455 RepID=A0A0A8L0Z0_9SACH|nr:unnamed protein product [Kluyveromyces dobzhanskii CBS 2104]